MFGHGGFVIVELIGVAIIFLHVQTVKGLLLQFKLLKVDLSIWHTRLAIVIVLKRELVKLRQHARPFKVSGDVASVHVLHHEILRFIFHFYFI